MDNAATLEIYSTELADPQVRSAIQLIYREATLLDDREYARWDELWVENDSRYVIPIKRQVTDFDAELNMVNDDTRMRRMRIDRMTRGYAGAVTATGPTVRTISRFTVNARTAHTVTLRSAQILVAYKRREHQIWAADLEHRIRFTENGPRIELKVIRLVDSDAPVPASGILL